MAHQHNNPALRLAPVDDTNRASVLGLALSPEQVNFVASNGSSLDEASQDLDAQPRAIMIGEQVVGFLMYDAAVDDDEATIYRFMIDRAYQGNGFGKTALRALLDEIGQLAHVKRISICYEPDNEGARHLYRSAGFVEQGLDEDGEMIANLLL